MDAETAVTIVSWSELIARRAASDGVAERGAPGLWTTIRLAPGQPVLWAFHRPRQHPPLLTA